MKAKAFHRAGQTSNNLLHDGSNIRDHSTAGLQNGRLKKLRLQRTVARKFRYSRKLFANAKKRSPDRPALLIAAIKNSRFLPSQLKSTA